VERKAIIREIETILDEFAASAGWGTIEIEIRDGQPNFIRKMTTKKLAQENTRGEKPAHPKS
jgi:hypothetical protein